MSWQKWFKIGINVAEDVIGPGLGAQKLGIAVSIAQAIAAAFAAQGTVAMGDAHDSLMITNGIQKTFAQMKASGEPIGGLVLGSPNQPNPVTGKVPSPPVLAPVAPAAPVNITSGPKLVPPVGSAAALAASAIAKANPPSAPTPAPQYSIADILAGKHLAKK